MHQTHRKYKELKWKKKKKKNNIHDDTNIGSALWNRNRAGIISRTRLPRYKVLGANLFSQLPRSFNVLRSLVVLAGAEMLLPELLSTVLHLPGLAGELHPSVVDLFGSRRVLPRDVPVYPRQHCYGRHSKPARSKEPHSQQGHCDHRGDQHGAEYHQQRGGHREGYHGARQSEPGQD